MKTELDTSTPKRRRWIRFFIPAFVALVVAAVFIPHNIVSRIAHDEISAVVTLRKIASLQRQHSLLYPSKGFTCDPTQLGAIASSQEEARTALRTFDYYEGYRFALLDCERDTNGIIKTYKATAAPLVPEKTGVRAFCEDETGELWYSVDGSAENCLAHRLSLQ